MSRRRATIGMVIVGATATLAIAGCGGSSSGSASATTGAPRAGRPAGDSYPVAVTASFPRRQSLSQRTQMVIAVRNTGHRTIPNVAVSVCNTTCAANAKRGQGTTVRAFSYAIGKAPNLANASRPIWIVLRGPGRCGYSCRNLGSGAAVTADSNTWALGRLAPGHTARFRWTVTAVKSGRFTVAWEVAAALDAPNRATLAPGRPARGTLIANVLTKPPHYVVGPGGQVTTKR